MKRSDFLKSLSALPFGIVAGNEVIKSIGKISDKDDVSVQGSINLEGLNKTTKTTDFGEVINRQDLVDVFIKRSGGEIGNTKFYAQTTRPTYDIEYQDNRLLKLNNVVYNKPRPSGEIKTHINVVKTRRCKKEIPFSGFKDREILSSVYDAVKDDRFRKGHECDIFILYNIIITPAIVNPTSFESSRGVMYRGAFVKF